MIQAIAIGEQSLAGVQQIGEEIMKCIAARDFEALGKHFHPRVACRLLVPPGLFTPLDASALVSKYQQWFGEADAFNIESSQITQVGDWLHVGYRIRLRESGRWHLIEQQTFSCVEDGLITRFDLLCSGFHSGFQPEVSTT